jgi:predicted dinucleotide-binding enzyme
MRVHYPLSGARRACDDPSMHVGIIGAGAIGEAFARLALRAGEQVLLANSRGPGTLEGVVATLGQGARAVTREDAAAARIVVLAVPWRSIPAAVAGIEWDGKILVDTTNPLQAPDFAVADLGGRTSSEVVAELAPGALLVKAANTLHPTLLGADPREAGGRRVLWVSSDDGPGARPVLDLLERAGWAPIFLGGLRSGGALQQFPGGPLPLHNLVKLG